MQLNRAIIEAAIIGFERQKEQIDETLAELRAQLADVSGNGRKTNIAEATTPTKARRKMSAAGRKAIAAAQKKRWAAVHKEGAPPKKAASVKKTAPKRKLSPAAKAKLVENLKKARAAKAAKKAA
jgi:hypothetical protein